MASQSESRAHHDGIADILRRLKGFFSIARRKAPSGLYVYFREPLYEKIAILGVANGRNRGAKNAYAILLQGAAFFKCQSQVKRGLPSEGEQYRIGPFFLYDLCREFLRERQKVYAVRKPTICLHGRNVRIHENDNGVLFFECLYGLRAGIVKFSRLAYLQATASEQKNFLRFIGHMKNSKHEIRNLKQARNSKN